MDSTRPEFDEIVKGWNTRGKDLKDIPLRLKKLKKLFGDDLNDREQEIVAFMKDVQADKEYLQRTRKNDEEDE